MARVQTVIGPIPPEELKITLPHEHLLCVTKSWRIVPDEARKQALVESPITLANRGDFMKDPNLSNTNLELLDINEAVNELMEFKKWGGTSLVELTVPGIGRDTLALQNISRVTGINIVCSSGFYAPQSHPSFVRSLDIDGVRDFIVRELREGVCYPVETGIKAGIIKCAALHSVSSEDEKVFRGAARAQKDTNAPFTIHPTLIDPDKRKKVFDQENIVKIIEQEGANLEKFYMSHMDLTCSDDRCKVNVEYHKRLMDSYPIILEYDTIGNEATHNSLWPGAVLASDNERLLAITELCEQGYEKQLMMSQDIYSKLQRVKYGGWGYAHILKHVVPRLRYMGVSEKQINTMMVDNPKRVLAY